MEQTNPLNSSEMRAVISGALGVSQQVLTNWKARGIPESKCAPIEFALKGRSTVEVMRPDVNWSRIPDKSWPHPKGRPVVDVSLAKESV